MAFLLSVAGGMGSAFAAVSVADLAANPLWMPATTSVKVDLSFTSGEKIRAGRDYKVYAVDGDQLRLWFAHGKGTFNVSVSDSQLLEDAEKRLAGMTDAQRELSPEVIAQRQDVWPLDVTMNRTITYDNGSSLRSGAAYTVTKFDGKQLEVFDARRNALFNVAPGDTDFYALCLEHAAVPPPSRLYRELARHVRDAGTLQPAGEEFLKGGGPEYIAIYYAAGWCPYCAQTSPGVMEWYQENEAREKKSIELVMVSRDKNSRQLQDHIAKLGFRSWVVSYDDVAPMIVLRNTPDSAGLPYLFVVDRQGNVVLQSTGEPPMERTQDMLARMRQLQTQLDEKLNSVAAVLP